MFHAIKSISLEAKPTPSSLPSPNFAGKVSPAIGSLRFHQVAAGTDDHPKPSNMEQKKKNEESTKEYNEKGDVMSHSFGEGYATRSEEEGFGGVYGGNQSLSHKNEDKDVHGNSPEYDKSQGSEVKEKEKARHQTHVH